LAILFIPFGFDPKDFYIIWLSNNMDLSVPDEGYSRNVPDEGYSRNVPDEGYSRNVPEEGYSRNVPDEGYSRNESSALNLSTFLVRTKVDIHVFIIYVFINIKSKDNFPF
jgi:hypothetical protein